MTVQPPFGARPSDANVLLQVLSDVQFTAPHTPLTDALGRLADQTGCCELVVRRAMLRLGLPPSIRIGRLRRTELSQLARRLHRLWRPALQAGVMAA